MRVWVRLMLKVLDERTLECPTRTPTRCPTPTGAGHRQFRGCCLLCFLNSLNANSASGRSYFMLRAHRTDCVFFVDS
jgi:hypothetical protein